MYNGDMGKRAVILQKPSGAIAIAGNMELREQKFYNGFLKFAKDRLFIVPDEHWFTISLTELKNNLGVKEDKHNTILKRIIKGMSNINVEYNLLGKDKNVEGYAHLLDNVEFVEYKKTGQINIKFSIPERVRLSMSQKGSLYASINLVIVRGLSSKYTIKLYELAKDYEKVEIPKMTMQEFRKLFGLIRDKTKNTKGKKNKEIKDKYTSIRDLKRRVLDVACSELTNNSNIDFAVSYKLIKTGKAYTHIKFIIKRKQPMIQEKQTYKNESEKQKMALFLSWLPREYRSAAAERILKKYVNKGAEYIQAQIKYTNNAEPKAYMAYLRDAIKKDYAGFEKSNLGDIITQQQKEAEEKSIAAEAARRKAEDAAKQERWGKAKEKWRLLPEEEKTRKIAEKARNSTTMRYFVSSKNKEAIDGIMIGTMVKDVDKFNSKISDEKAKENIRKLNVLLP